MGGKRRKNPVLANPFFVLLMVVGTLFVVTALGWLVAGAELNSERAQAAAEHGFAAWLDRYATLILGLEFAVMLVAGILAMITEDWFMGKQPTRPGAGDGSRG